MYKRLIVHICERNTVTIDERENIQNYFIDILSFFYESSQERKYILKMGNVHIILQFGTHLEYLTLFNVIIRAILRLM